MPDPDTDPHTVGEEEGVKVPDTVELIEGVIVLEVVGEYVCVGVPELDRDVEPQYVVETVEEMEGQGVGVKVALPDRLPLPLALRHCVDVRVWDRVCVRDTVGQLVGVVDSQVVKESVGDWVRDSVTVGEWVGVTLPLPHAEGVGELVGVRVVERVRVPLAVAHRVGEEEAHTLTVGDLDTVGEEEWEGEALGVSVVDPLLVKLRLEEALMEKVPEGVWLPVELRHPDWVRDRVTVRDRDTV